MADAGYKLGTLTAVDSSLSIPAGGAPTTGSTIDLGAVTSPQSVGLSAQIAITNVGSTDGYDLEVYVQWSDDNTNWPDSSEGEFVMLFSNSTAGADLTLSNLIRLPTPQARYCRLLYINNNATDAVTVSSEVAQHLTQSA